MRGGRSFHFVWQTEMEVESERTKKKLRGVIAPISMPNDYLDTVVDDVVSQRWSKKKCSPTVPSEKLQFDGILSLRVKSLSAQDDKKGILFVDRPVK